MKKVTVKKVLKQLSKKQLKKVKGGGKNAIGKEDHPAGYNVGIQDDLPG